MHVWGLKEDRIMSVKLSLVWPHGEPGVQQIDFKGAKASMDRIVATTGSCKGNVVAILNNLGGTTPLEAVLTQALNDRFAHYLIGPSSDDLIRHACLVSVMEVSDEELNALNQSVPMPVWPGLAKLGVPLIAAFPMDWHSR